MSARILFLEDNLDVVDSMKRAFEIRGIECVWAANVKAAQTLYVHNAFDVIVLDYELPDGTGLDTLRMIREAEEAFGAPDKAVIVLYSGLDRSSELAAAGLTVTHQISKGDPFALFDVIERLT